MNTEVPGGKLPDPGTDDPSTDGFVLRMLLGSQLRRLREEAGIAPDRAGCEIRVSRSKISRIGAGRGGLKLRDVEDLITFVRVEGRAALARYLYLARDQLSGEALTRCPHHPLHRAGRQRDMTSCRDMKGTRE